MILSPVTGLVLFVIFGVRKREEMRRIRFAVARAAGLLRGVEEIPADEFDDVMTSGNKVSLLADAEGTATFLEMRRRIAGARDFINIVTYIFDDERHRPGTRPAARARAREGVRVRLLIDALGSRDTGDAMFRELTDAGGEVERFMPMAPWKHRSSANLRNHRKLAVFDGGSAIVGGQNLAARYTGPRPEPGRFRDFGALIEGPAAAAFNRLFAADWCFATGGAPDMLRYDLTVKPDPAGNSGVEVVGRRSGFPERPDLGKTRDARGGMPSRTHHRHAVHRAGRGAAPADRGEDPRRRSRCASSRRRNPTTRSLISRGGTTCASCATPTRKSCFMPAACCTENFSSWTARSA